MFGNVFNMDLYCLILVFFCNVLISSVLLSLNSCAFCGCNLLY